VKAAPHPGLDKARTVYIINEMADELVDARVKQLLGSCAFDQAMTLALEAYGAELHGFLIHALGNRTAAGDVFSRVVEKLWRGLPRFAARCSVRTWLYLLARHAVVDHQRDPWHGAHRTGDAGLDAIVDRVRSETPPWRRTDVKDQWRALREALTPDDRTLLVLRVDRDLAWTDIARVTLGDPEPNSAALTRETARLRKRFQLLKLQLREQARESGLLAR
jgi:RNA polymerase sigma-70 factor (ECF subfamily)